MAAAPNLGYFATLAALIAAYAATSVPAGTIAYTGDRGPVWSDANVWRPGFDGSNNSQGAGTGIFNLTAQNTKHVRAGIARVRSGRGIMKSLYIGDSTTMGLYALSNGSTGARPYCIANCVAKILNQRYSGYGATSGAPISHAESFFSDNYVSSLANVTAYDTRLAFSGTWVLSTDLFFAAGTFVSASSGATLSFTPAIAFDTIDIYYITAPTYSSFTVNINGGSTLATVTTNIAASLLKTTVSCTAGTAGANTVKIVAGSGSYNEIAGIAVRLSTAPAIEHYNGGASGTTAAGQASTSGAPFNTVNGIPVVAPDVTHICLDINNINGSTQSSALAALPAWQTAIGTLITAGQGTGDVILRTGNPIGQAAGTNGAAAVYYAAYYQLALQYNVPLIDISARWQSYAITDPIMPYGDDSVSGYLHPTAVGYYDIAAAIADCFPA
jgi:lysophospholipase L1-like esterase